MVAEAAALHPPSEDPAAPPEHPTGGAVDLTLSWRAAARAFEATPGPVRTLRRLLYHVLRGQGFVVLAEEWWHFEFGTRPWSALTGRPCRYGPAAP